jgi:hypothetical protein
MSFIAKEAYDDLQCRYIQVADMLRRIVADYRRSDEDARGVSAMEYLIEEARRIPPENADRARPTHTARFELRQDEDTDRLYWWGAENGWKDATEIGENGVLTLDASAFAIGTVLTLIEPGKE